MKPKERISIIIEIVKKLSSFEYPQIDLILTQYGFSTFDEWHGTKEGYIQDMIQNYDDEKLLDLYSYFNDITSDISVDFIDKSWNENSFCIFFSHLASDKIRTANLQRIMQNKYNFSCFVAHVDIEPGNEWQIEIEKALNLCDALVALLVPGFHDSSWTDQEIGFVMGRKKKIISVRLGMDPYGFIGKFQGIQGIHKSEDQIALEIFRVLSADDKTKKKISNAIVFKFENSESFADAKTNMELLESLSYFDANLLGRIEKADKENHQINQSWGVSDRVKTLIRKFS